MELIDRGQEPDAATRLVLYRRIACATDADIRNLWCGRFGREWAFGFAGKAGWESAAQSAQQTRASIIFISGDAVAIDDDVGKDDRGCAEIIGARYFHADSITTL